MAALPPTGRAAALRGVLQGDLYPPEYPFLKVASGSSYATTGYGLEAGGIESHPDLRWKSFSDRNLDHNNWQVLRLAN